jgi:hypothetical protein
LFIHDLLDFYVEDQFYELETPPTGLTIVGDKLYVSCDPPANNDNAVEDKGILYIYKIEKVP